MAAVAAAPATLLADPPLPAPPLAAPVLTSPPAEPARVPQRAVLVAVVAIAVGGVMQGVSYLLARDQHLSAAADIRFAMLLTLTLYAVVGVLVASQLTGSVRLRWSDGQPVLGVAIGVAVGGGLSLALLGLVSAAVGHLSPDPRIVLLMSEGDAPHIVIAVLVACVAAPLVEETLFRGLLLESQRHRGRGAAIWLSAIAFAVWHFAPSALRYYALLGSLLGLLYVKRGLACSIAAHVGFNGVLTVAALSVVLSPGPSLDAGGLSVHLPGGWRASSEQLPSGTGIVTPLGAFDGPSGATIEIASKQTPVAASIDQIVAGIDEGFGTRSVESRSMREVQLPVGTVLEMNVDIAGTPGAVAVVPHAGTSYELVLVANGSAKATSDFQRMLRGLSVS